MARRIPVRVSYRGSTYRVAAKPNLKKPPIERKPSMKTEDVEVESVDDVMNDLMSLYMDEDFDFKNNLIVSLQNTIDSITPAIDRLQKVDTLEVITSLLSRLTALRKSLTGIREMADLGDNPWEALQQQASELSKASGQLRQDMGKLPDSIKALEDLGSWSSILNESAKDTQGAIDSIKQVIQQAVG